MFFDETFDGLDPVIRNTMKKIIAKQIDTDNTTIVMTSHNLRELEDICENLGLLHKGGILFESDIDTLKTNMFKVQISLKGDFSEEEVAKAIELGFQPVSLGKSRLRTETAALVAVHTLNLFNQK